jgi:hypothetical protein
MPRPGDFNGDGFVDGSDFLVWQRGESPRPSTSLDLDEWRGAFGGGITQAASPEPQSWVLLVVVYLALVRCRHLEERIAMDARFEIIRL